MLVTKLIGAPKTSDTTFGDNVLLINGDVYTNFTQTDVSNSQLPLRPTGNPQSSQFTPFNGNSYSIKFKSIGGDAAANDTLRISADLLEMYKSDWTMECFFMPVFQVENNSTIIRNDNFRWGFDSNNIFVTSNTTANDSSTMQIVGNYAHGMLPNQWYHLVITNSKSTISFYVDGKLLGTGFNRAIAKANATSNNFVTIGPLNGYLSQLRVVKDAALYYGESFDIPTEPLTNQLPNPTVATFIDPNATVSLLCCQSKALIDNSGLNNVITSRGSPVITDSNPFSNSYEDFLYNSQSTYFHNNYSLTSSTYGYGIPMVIIMMEDLGTTNDFTIESWAYQSSSSSSIKLSVFFFNERYKNNYGSSLNSGNYVHIYLCQGRLYLQTGYHGVGTTPLGFAHPSAGIVGKWNHVALTRKDGVFYLFFNGIMSLITDTSMSHITSLGPRFLVATDNSRDKANGTIFDRGDGKITNMRVVKDQALFTDDFTVSTLPLRKDTVGHTGGFVQNGITGKVLFLGFQNAALKDNSGLNAQVGFGGVIPYYQYPTLTNASTKASYIPRQANLMDSNYTDSLSATRNIVWFAPAGAVSINHMHPDIQLASLINPSFTMEVWAYGPASYIVSGGSGIYNTYHRSSGTNGYNGGDLYPYAWYWKAGEFSWLEKIDYQQPDYTRIGTSVEFLDTGYVSLDTEAGDLGAGTWTIEFWWQASGTQQNEATIISKDNGAGNYSWMVKVTGNSPANGYGVLAMPSIQFLYYNSGWKVISTGNHLCDNIHDGQWHHVAITRNSNVISIFMDGFIVTTASNVPDTFDFGTSLSNPVTIGYNSINTTSSYLYGKISNLRIVKDAVIYTTPSDIYTGQASFEPPTSDLAVYTTGGATTLLLWAQGATPLVDVSNGYTVTYVNTPQPVATTVGPWSPVNYKFARSTRNYATVGVGVDGDGNTIGVWTHLAVSVNAGVVTMYMNGQADTMATSTTISQIVQKESLGDNIVLGSVWKQYGNYSSQIPMTNLRITRRQGLFTGAFTPSTAVLTKSAVGHTGTGAAASLTGTVILLLTDSNIDSSDYKILWNYNTFALGSYNNFEKYPAVIYSGSTQLNSPFTYNNNLLTQGNYSTWLPSNSAIYTSSGIGTLNPANFNFGDFNIEFWAWLRGSARTILSTNTLINGANTWEIVVDTSGNLVFSSYGKTIFSFPVYTKYNNGNWNHFLISRRSLTICFYINGKQVYQAPQDTVSWYLWPDNSLYLGYNPESSNASYSGTVAMHGLRIVKGQALVSGAAVIPSVSNAQPLTTDANTIILTANTSNISTPLTTNGGSLVSYNTFAYNNNNIIWYFGSSRNSSDAFSVTDNANNVLQFGTNKDWTIETWIYPLGATSTKQVIAGKYKSSNGWYLYLAANTNGLSFWDNGTDFSIGSVAPTLNSWNHVAVTYYRKGSTNYFSMFLNGRTVLDSGTRETSQSANIAVFTHSDNTGTLNIGTLIDSANYQNAKGFNYTSGQYNFNGYINNFRIITNQAIYQPNLSVPFIVPTTNSAAVPNYTALLANVSTGTLVDSGDNNSYMVLSGNSRIITGNLFGSSYTMNLYGLQDVIAEWNSADAAPTRGFAYVMPNKSNYLLNNDAWTIDFWVQNQSVSNTRYLCSYGHYGQSHLFGLYLDSSQQLFMVWRTTDGYDFTSSVNLTPNAVNRIATNGTWTHIALTMDKGLLTSYINGSPSWHGYTQDLPLLWKTSAAIPEGTHGNSWYLKNYHSGIYNGDFIRIPQTTPTTTYDLSSGSANFGLDDFTLETWIYNFSLAAPPGYPRIWCNHVTWTSQSIDAAPWVNTNSPFGPSISGGNSVYFGSSAGSVSLTPGSNFAFGTTSDFTIEYWIKHGTTSADILTSTSANWGIVYSAAQYYWQSKFTATSEYPIPGSNSQSLKTFNNRWHHIAVVRYNGIFRFFINGKIVFEDLNNTTNYTGTGVTWHIGGYRYYGVPNSYMSNMRVLNGVAAYTGAFTPPNWGDLAKTGAASASLYPSTTNVNTTFASSACVLLTLQGSSIVDASDYSATNNLTVNGGTRVTDISPADLDNFKTSTNYSYYFGTSGEHLVYANAAPLNLAFSSAWTVELWVNINQESSGAARFLFGKRNWGGNCSYQGYITYDYDRPAFYNGAVYASPVSMTLGKWTHLGYVYDGANINIYMDGVSIYTNPISQNPANALTYPFTIGGGQGNQEGTQGYISNLRMIKDQALFTGTFTPSTAPLSNVSVGHTGTGAASSITGTVVVLTAQDPIIKDNGISALPVTTSGTFTRHITTNNPQGAPDLGFTVYTGLYTHPTKYSIHFNGIGEYTGVIPIGYDKWQHIALVKRNGSLNFYVDGNLDISVALAHAAQRYPIVSTVDNFQIGAAPELSGTDGPTAWLSGMRISKKAVYYGNFAPPTYLSTVSSAFANAYAVDSPNVTLLLGNTNTFVDSSQYNNTIVVNGTPFIGKFNNADVTVTPPNGSWYLWYIGSKLGEFKYASDYDFRGNISNFRVLNGISAYKYWNEFTVPNSSFSNTSIGTANGYPVANALTGNVALLTAIADPSSIMDLGNYGLTVNVYGAPTALPYLNQFSAPNAGAYSISFTSGSSVDLAASSSYVFGAGTNFTIEFWMFLNNTNSYQTLLDQYQSGTTGAGNWRVAIADGQIIWNYDGKNYIRTGSSTTINNNNWTHVALQRRSGSLKILVNGADTWWTTEDTGWPYAGGNFIANSTYVIHQFTTSTTWYMPDTVTADILVVAGGGAGGSPIGGGGGAGGLTYSTSQTLTPNSYAILVGAGGTAALDSDGTSGGDSKFIGGSVSIYTYGGGGGGKYNTGSGSSGGSGGGGAAAKVGGSGTSGQGNSGGSGYSAAGNGAYGAGGGGGAGAAGENGGNRGYYYSSGGRGGIGLINSVTGTAQYYAAGGGGGATASMSSASGGLGGGGRGGTDYSWGFIPTSATALTGSGGGGGGNDAASYPAGNGASGVVIVRYPRTTSLVYPTATFNGTYGRSDLPIRMGNVQNGTTGISLNGYLSNLKISNIARYTANVGSFTTYIGNLNATAPLHVGNSVVSSITGNVFLTATANSFVDIGTNTLTLSMLSDSRNASDNLPVNTTALPYTPTVVLPNGYQSVTYANSNLSLGTNSLLYDYGTDDFTIEYWMYPTKGNVAIFNTWGANAQNGYGMSLTSLPFSIDDQNANYNSSDGTVIFYPIIGSTLKLFVQGNVSAEIIMAAGGGGGGAGGWLYGGGGGGGGGVVHLSNVWMQTGNLLVSIGAGGTGAGPGSSGSVGGDTYIQSINMPNFDMIYANGGGYGGDTLAGSGFAGGSGGGGSTGGTYSPGFAGQGYPGGAYDSTYGGGGGGGGAGGRGFSGRQGDGGAGGLGYQSYIGTSPIYFAAGGGGGGGGAGLLRTRFGFGGASGIGGVGTGGGVDGQGGGIILSSTNAINAGGGGGSGTTSASTGVPVKTGGNGGYGVVQMKFNPITLLRLDTYINGVKQTMIANALPVMNTWNHVALTQHNNKTAIWLNGQFAGNTNTPITQSYTAGANLVIGSDPTGNLSSFSGQIADLRIVKGQSLYNADFDPSITPLTSAQNRPLYNNIPNAAVQVLTAQQPYLLNEYNNANPFSNSVYLDGNCWIEFDLPIPVNTQDFTFECWVMNMNIGTDGYNLQTPALAVGTPATTYVTGTQIALKPPQNASTGLGLYWPALFSATRAPTTDYDWSATNYSGYATPTWHHIMVVRQWNLARTNSFLTTYINGYANNTTDNAGYANFNIAGTKLRIGRDFAQYNSVTTTPNGLNGGNFKGKITNVRFAYHAVIQNPSGASPKDATTGSGQVFVPSLHPLDAHDAGHMPLSTTEVRDIPAGKCGLLTLQTANLTDRGDFNLTGSFKGTSSPQWDLNYLYPFSTNIVSPDATNGSGNYPNVSALSPFGINTDGSGSVYFPTKNNTSLYTGRYIPAFQMGIQDFTCEAWVYPTDDVLDGWNVLCSVGSTIGGKTLLYFALNTYSNAGVGFYITYEDGTEWYFGSGQYVKKNVWSHVAWTKTGDYGAVFRVFVNGKSVRTRKQADNIHSNVWIAGTEAGIRFTVNGTVFGDTGFIGYVSNLRIIKGQSLYTSSFVPPRDPYTLTNVGTSGLNVATTLTGGVSFLGFTTPFHKNANSFVDSSTYNWQIKSTGTVFQGTQTPFPLQAGTGYVPSISGGGAGFDGLTANLSIAVDGNANDEWALRGNPFTIETWIKDINTSGKGTIISSGTGNRWGNINANNYSNIGFSFGVDSNGLNGSIFANLGNLQFNSTTTGEVYNVGEWNHIAVTRDWPIYANGYSWSFDGGSAPYSYMMANVAANPNLNIGKNDFTIDFWAYPKPNASRTNPAFFSTSNSHRAANVLSLFVGHSGFNTKTYQLSTNTLNSVVKNSNANVMYNTWTHFAINRTGANINLFINGNLDTYMTGNYANNFVSADSFFYVGTGGPSYAPQNSAYTGLISNFRVTVGTSYNAGYGALYSNNFTVPTRPVSSNIFSYGDSSSVESMANIANSHVQLLVAQDTRYTDNSGNSIVTLSGNVTTQAVSPFGSNVNLWINGVNAGAFTSNVDVDLSASQITMGSDYHGFFRYGGYMSQLRVTKNINLFKGNFTPATGPLGIDTVGHTGSSVYAGNLTGNVMLLMSCLNLGILPDWSGTSFVVPYANATVDSSVVKFGSGSVAFNGYSDYLSIRNGSQEPYQFTGEQDFTIEFWVYCVDIQRTQVFYDTRPLGVRTGGYVTAYLYYNPATTQSATSSGINLVTVDPTKAHGDAAKTFAFTLPISSVYNYAGYFAVGSKVFINPLTGTGAPGGGYMEGTVYSYVGTTLTVDITYSTGGGTYTTWIIQDNGTAVFSCDVGTRTIRATSTTVQPNAWTFITICRKNQVLRFFVDGIQQGTDVPMTEYLDDAFDRPFFGVDSSNMANYFNGYMDDIRISRIGRYDTTFAAPALAFLLK